VGAFLEFSLQSSQQLGGCALHVVVDDHVVELLARAELLAGDLEPGLDLPG
jgi:hypothetical protein